jgi:hypothetical protein
MRELMEGREGERSEALDVLPGERWAARAAHLAPCRERRATFELHFELVIQHLLVRRYVGWDDSHANSLSREGLDVDANIVEKCELGDMIPSRILLIRPVFK